MKVVLLNTSETKGGAAIACKRLLNALRNNGVDVKMLVRDKGTNDPDVISLNRSYIQSKFHFVLFVWERLQIFIANRFSRKNLFAVSTASTGIDLSKNKYVLEADIIHLHWVNQGFLSLNGLQQLLLLGKPIVWTMHDMWPATGICHYAQDCKNFQSDCSNCFYLHNSHNKLANKIFSQKKQIYQSSISIVTCSEWLLKMVKQSALLQQCTKQAIPNPIDTQLFRPLDKDCQFELGLPTNKLLILFGAAKLSDKRKGLDYFIEALLHIHRTSELLNQIEIVFLGTIEPDVIKLIPFPCHVMGYVSDINKVIQIYNAACIFVIPSLEDNLPNTIMEAMACGTPCVGFNTGGIPEMIDHKTNGYIADYKSSTSLAEGMLWCLDANRMKQLSEAAINKVALNYSEKTVGKKYKNEYVLRIKNQISSDLSIIK